MNTQINSGDSAEGPSLEWIEAKIRESLNGELDLPVLPTVVTEILQNSGDDDRYDPSHLATVIQQDQSIASHVLRVVNSPMFQGAQKVVALQQAITRLGINTLTEIAVSASMGNHFACVDYAEVIAAYWAEALGTALWSKEVARAAKTNVEVAYLAGLLHNIGAPLIIQSVSKLGCTDLSDDDMRSLVTSTHRKAGVILSREWRLPPAVPATIENFDDPDKAAGFENIVASVNLGSQFVRAAMKSTFDPVSLADGPASNYLSIYPDQLTALWERRDRVYEMLGLLA